MSGFAATDTDWFASVNRLATAVAALSFIVFFGALIYAGKQIAENRDAYDLARTKALGGKNQTINHLEELVFLTEHEQIFSDWQGSGKIGPTDEMIWVETLLEIGARVDARRFRYRIGGSQAVESIQGASIDQVAVSRLDIRLDFEADHGESVFRFFTDVQNEASGTFGISAFSLERIESELPKTPHGITPVAMERAMLSKPEVAGGTSQNSGFGGVKVQATLSWLTIDPEGRL